MLSDRRQQELITQWATLSLEELIKWIEQQPDQEELLELVVTLELQNSGRRKLDEPRQH